MDNNTAPEPARLVQIAERAVEYGALAKWAVCDVVTVDESGDLIPWTVAFSDQTPDSIKNDSQYVTECEERYRGLDEDLLFEPQSPLTIVQYHADGADDPGDVLISAASIDHRWLEHNDQLLPMMFVYIKVRIFSGMGRNLVAEAGWEVDLRSNTERFAFAKVIAATVHPEDPDPLRDRVLRSADNVLLACAKTQMYIVTQMGETE